MLIIYTAKNQVPKLYLWWHPQPSTELQSCDLGESLPHSPALGVSVVGFGQSSGCNKGLSQLAHPYSSGFNVAKSACNSGLLFSSWENEHSFSLYNKIQVHSPDYLGQLFPL